MTQPIPVSQISTAADLLQAYAAGQRNFEYVILIGVSLAQADLKGADFSYADFSDANLSQANLRGADLSYTNLSQADLSGADLRGAMLIGTDLRTAMLSGTKLDVADYDPQDTHFPPGFDPVQQGLKADR
jgi:uncharacterized protein YjbI with pentapeptide repeats